MPEKLKKRKSKKMLYFFHNGQLHKTLYISRPRDFMYAWSYPERKRVTFNYSDIKRTHGKAFRLVEVSKMINRRADVIEEYILKGHIRRPQMSYTLDGNFNPVKYFFSEENVLELHDYLMTVHFGRPRKDGLINPYPTPTKSELRAMMTHEIVYYIENDAGEKVKVFKESPW